MPLTRAEVGAQPGRHVGEGGHPVLAEGSGVTASTSCPGANPATPTTVTPLPCFMAHIPVRSGYSNGHTAELIRASNRVHYG
jgi:hypothetical protein